MKRSFLPTILLACALVGAFTIGYVLRDSLQPESSSRELVDWDRNSKAHSGRRELLRPRNVGEDGSEATGRFREGIPVPMPAGSWSLAPTQRPTQDGNNSSGGGVIQPVLLMPQLRTVAMPTFFVPVNGGGSRLLGKDEIRTDNVNTERVASYVVFGPERDDAAFQSMKEVLIGTEKEVTVSQAETLREGIESEADVLVLLRGRGSVPEVTKELIEPFKKRKVIGVGIGAAGVFEAAGLKVGPSNIVFGRGGAFTLSVQKNSVVDPVEVPISVFDPPLGKNDRFPDQSLFAYYVGPRKPENRKGVEVIASWTSDENFASVAREGNAVLIGVNGRVGKWSPEFRELVRKVALGLAGR